MRKALTLAVALALVGGFVVPAGIAAQNQLNLGMVSGKSVDVAGRGMSGERVQLLSGTDVLDTATTNGLGEWSFRSVKPGIYTVRMNVRGRIAGVRVTVGTGQTVAGTMIVVPAATASLQLGALTNLLALVPAGTAATVSTVAATIAEVETLELSPQILVDILNALPVDVRQAFAAAVVEAIEDQATGSAPFAQYQEQLEAVRDNPVLPVPPLPDPTPVNVS